MPHAMSAARSIFIVEDEPLIAMMLEDFVETLGYQVVGTTDSVPGALARLPAADFDMAILDVNLQGGQCWPIADALAAAGIPFVVSTGGQLDPFPARYADVPTLTKPYAMNNVREALAICTMARDNKKDN